MCALEICGEASSIYTIDLESSAVPHLSLQGSQSKDVLVLNALISQSLYVSLLGGLL